MKTMNCVSLILIFHENLQMKVFHESYLEDGNFAFPLLGSKTHNESPTDFNLIDNIWLVVIKVTALLCSLKDFVNWNQFNSPGQIVLGAFLALWSTNV